MNQVRQWDIVRFRIRPQDAELHPGVIVSGEEWCASGQTTNLNVLACSKRTRAAAIKPHQVVLNGGDGLDFQSTADCRFFHIIPKESVTETIGRVSAERRRAIGRKINEILRLLL
jgi:mRNA-degrading endonuclease toxin of MazEF toxin-antitoxin module